MSSTEDGGSTGREGNSLSVGPAGDTLSAAGVELIVPAGALSEETTFSISVLLSGYPELAADYELRSAVIALEPHGLSFLKPVSLALPFTGDTVPELQMISANPGGTWAVVEGASFEQGMARAALRHFSLYAIVAKKALLTPMFTEHVYVPDQTQRAIYVYDIGPGASDQPSRVIRGPQTKIVNPQSLVVDRFGALFVVDFDLDVKVFSPDANGDVEPFFTFASAVHPRSITDANNPTVVGWTVSSELWGSSLYLFSDPYQTSPGKLLANFDYANLGAWTWSSTGPWGCGAKYSGRDMCMQVPMLPLRTVLCPGTDIPDCLHDQGSGNTFELTGRGVGASTNGVKFRPDGKLTIVWYRPDTVATHGFIFDDSAPGYAALKLYSSVTGPATGLNLPFAADFDQAGNMYVVNRGWGSGQGTVTVYPQDADGDVAPSRTLGQLDFPMGIAVGP